MLVKDIKEDINQVLGMCDDDTIYNRLSYAIEVLANKGQWDSLTTYLDIVVQSGRIVTLPNAVEIPIKININNNPSFSRGQLYEFTLNGPGNDMADTAGFSWLNKGNVPVMAQPASPDVIGVFSSGTADNGLNRYVYLKGFDQNNVLVSEKVLIDSVIIHVSNNQYKKLTEVAKDNTDTVITIKSNAQVLSSYLPFETEINYRQIRITKDAAALRMLVRLKTNQIFSDDDFIPLQSKMAILMMIYSLEEYRKGADFQKAQAYEQQALKFLQEEQVSRNNFDTVKNTEMQPTLDLNYSNPDSIIVADMYDESSEIYGPIGREGLFDRLSDGLELLTNKGHWDGTIGYVDIVVYGGLVTLPRYVDAVLAMNICRQPTQMRNKWCEFHINGWGTAITPCGYWDDMGGDAVTIRPIISFVQLIAQPESELDDGKFMTIYGRDNKGRELGSVVDGEFVAGLKLTLNHLGPQPPTDATQVSYIDRVVKDTTQGYVQLQAFDTISQQPYLLGFYHPDETEPRYRRVKLPNNLTPSQVRIRYRKRALRVKSLTEPLHLRSKLSLSAAMRSVKALKSGDLQNASQFEALAVQYLEEDQIAHNPGEVVNFQVSGINKSRVII